MAKRMKKVFSNADQVIHIWASQSQSEALGFKALCLDVNSTFAELFDSHIEMAIARTKEIEAKKFNPEEIAKRERAATRKAELQLEKIKADVEKWRAGGALTDGIRTLNKQIIRIKGEEVETSKGASVPLSHALRLFRKITSGVAKSGERIGHYTFNDMDLGTIHIGCHAIELSEARSVLSTVEPKLKLVE